MLHPSSGSVHNAWCFDYPDCSGHTALSPQADIYVSDGYQNARVHKYSPDGKLLFSWGEPGTDAGQFNLVHNIACDALFDEAGPRSAIAEKRHRRVNHRCGRCSGQT